MVHKTARELPLTCIRVADHRLLIAQLLRHAPAVLNFYEGFKFRLYPYLNPFNYFSNPGARQTENDPEPFKQR